MGGTGKRDAAQSPEAERKPTRAAGGAWASARVNFLLEIILISYVLLEIFS